MARGSIRQRGRGRWELRVYAGVDAATGRQRYVTRTVHGSRRTAVRALDDWRRRSILAALLRVVVDRPLLWCLLRLAATTGARRGQLLALQWRDIDLDRGVIAFTRALVVGPDGPVLGATKTDATHCTDLDAESAQMLRRCRAAAEQRAAAAGVSLPGAAYLFSDDLDGRRPWPPDRATKQFTPLAARPVCLTSVCMICATSWPRTLSAGVPLATVSQRLNHARISTTVDVYTHAIPAWDRPAAERLAAILAGDNNTPEHARRS
jgi:integrase